MMKAVIQTQHLENYGAHDWDGKGECPQRWKYKGGDTYIIDLTIEENMSPEWWTQVQKCIEYKNDYCQEYIIGETIVDDIDFREEDHIPEWDTAIYGIKLSDRAALMCRRLIRSYDISNRVVGERSWLQTKDGREEMARINYEEAA